VDEVVLCQVVAAIGDVSGHVQQLQHGESGALALHTGKTHTGNRYNALEEVKIHAKIHALDAYTEQRIHTLESKYRQVNL